MFIDKTTLYQGKEVAMQYGIRSAPTFMIINKEGTIIYTKSGFDEAELLKVIKANL